MPKRLSGSQLGHPAPRESHGHPLQEARADFKEAARLLKGSLSLSSSILVFLNKNLS